MFFNLDKNAKQNLLNEYKQEALNFYQKKKEEREKKLQEEREYITQREQLEKEADEKLFREKLQRKNAQMEEYQTMLLKTKNNIPGYRHNQNKNEIVLNNWGGQEKSHQIQKKPENQNQNLTEKNISNLKNNIISHEKSDQDIFWRERRGRKIFGNEDHLVNYLNDDRNDKELNNIIKGEKEYKQKLYKDLLYSQFQEVNNRNLNLYGTNDPLILERKRKRNMSENPYNKKNNYEFGKSNLSHNPITDPQNNFDYNKYLRFSESNNNIRNNINSNLNNKNNYQANNYQIQQKNYDQQNINNNYNNRINDQFKTINYDNSTMNKNSEEMNNNYNTFNPNNQYNINNGGNQISQNQNNSYINNSFRPTPSGVRIRQAAASNFL